MKNISPHNLKPFGTLTTRCRPESHGCWLSCTDLDLEKLGLECGDLMEMDNIDAFRKKATSGCGALSCSF